MAQAVLQKKIKELFDKSMPNGGLPFFKLQFEQSLGIEEVEAVTNEGTIRKHKVLNPNGAKMENGYKSFEIGGVMNAMLGRDWRNTFEQHWVEATQRRYNFEQGSAVLPGDISYVSAAIDVIAGLANARALERPMHEAFLFNELCTVQEIVGEGGFDIITRSRGDKGSRDLASGQALPTAKITQSRVHRNRTLDQGLRTEVNKDVILDDLTGTLYESVDENSDQILMERDQKAFDCLAGITAGTGAANSYATLVSQTPNIGVDGLAIPMSQDGLQFYPYQKGFYGSNPGAGIVSPQNQKTIQDFANDGATDGQGLSDYKALVRALQVLTANTDPFTGRAPDIRLNGMSFLCIPSAAVQIEYLLAAKMLWQMGNGGLNATGGTANVSDYNFFEKNALKMMSSQYLMSRLVSIGVAKVSGASGAAQTYAQQKLTNAATDTYNTVGSVQSAFLMGNFKKAVKYAQRTPYTVAQIPLSSQDYAQKTVMIQDVREQGQAYFVNPREVWRAWA